MLDPFTKYEVMVFAATGGAILMAAFMVIALKILSSGSTPPEVLDGRTIVRVTKPEDIYSICEKANITIIKNSRKDGTQQKGSPQHSGSKFLRREWCSAAWRYVRSICWNDAERAVPGARRGNHPGGKAQERKPQATPE